LKKKNNKVDKIGVTGNTDKPGFVAAACTVSRLIHQHGFRLEVDHASASVLEGQLPVRLSAVHPDRRALAKSVDLLIVLGGDGTMLRVAHEVAGVATPILGVNIGGMGFLTAIPITDFSLAILYIKKHEFELDRRFLVLCEARVGRQHVSAIALNEISILRADIPRLVELEVYIDDEFVTRYRSDGLLISTPTGSTAYSLAAGGAIIVPGAHVLALTPVCPHTLSNRAMIIDADSVVRIRVATVEVDCILSADSQVVGRMVTGDSVIIRHARRWIQLIQLPGMTFYSTLRMKLHWRGTSI